MSALSTKNRAAVAVVEMTADEARECADKIRGHIDSARALVLELYERAGWNALGYGSWLECVQAEFDQSKSHLYRQLEAAVIEREISPMGEIGSIPERQLRPLAKLPVGQRASAWKEATEVSGGKPTAAVVQDVVNHRTGQCRVDGVLVDDPSEIAERRKKGEIPEGVIPEITSPDPNAATVDDVKEAREERAAIKDEIGDEDWLKALPLSSQLKDRPLKVFRADAIYWRHLDRARKAFGKASAELLNKAGRIGTYGHKIRSALSVKPPAEWKRCPEPKYDGCNGVGQTPIGNCHKCFGRGYLLF